jgi:hypothetical protein
VVVPVRDFVDLVQLQMLGPVNHFAPLVDSAEAFLGFGEAAHVMIATTITAIARMIVSCVRFLPPGDKSMSRRLERRIGRDV